MTLSKRDRNIWIGIGTTILVVVLFLVWWNNGLRDFSTAKNFGVVQEHEFFRSGQIHPRLIRPTLEKNGIETVVSLIGTCRRMDWVEEEKNASKEMGIEWKNFPLDGKGRGNIDSYVNAIEAIYQSRKMGKPVLVHCFAGAQRTGGVVASYRMLVDGVSPEAAMEEMGRFGWDHDDNPVLVPYLNENMRGLAQALVDRGVIAKVPEPLPVLKP